MRAFKEGPEIVSRRRQNEKECEQGRERERERENASEGEIPCRSNGDSSFGNARSVSFARFRACKRARESDILSA